MLGDDQPEGGVADEGERFLVGQWRVLVGVGGVRERALEERAVAEAMAETRLEGGQARGVERLGGQARYLRKTRVALVPPKPKALDSASSTSCLRAWLGT